MPADKHDARSPGESLEYLLVPWRTGRKVARNIYAQVGDEPDDDVAIGSMDTGQLAREAVQRHNDALEARQRRR